MIEPKRMISFTTIDSITQNFNLHKNDLANSQHKKKFPNNSITIPPKSQFNGILTGNP